LSAIVALNPTTTSVYSVTGTSTLGGCTNTAALTLSVVVCTGIEEVSNEVCRVKAYPNPCAGRFVLESEQTLRKMELTDALGRLLFTALDLSGKKEIPLSEKGIYFIKWYGLNDSGTIKVISE
jgi:hypothetical protein